MSFVENWNQVVSNHHKQSENKIVNKAKDDFWEDKVEGFIPPKLPDYNDPTLSFLITSKIRDSNTAIKPTKIIDSYSVETGGRFKIVILIIRPDR